MCGITGIIDHEGLYLHDLEGMSNTLRHRGPDDEGYLVVSNKGSCFLLGGEDTIKDCQLPNISNFQDCTDHIIGMGHRRLSIIDLSANGHQPLNLGQLYIVYNGEIYNYIEIRNELISYGREFCTNTDTEVILQAYQQWGSDCVNRFVGMWSFAIFDVTSFTIFFSRDRYGIKPLYYYLDGHVFAFASEIKSLFSFSKIKRKVHDRNLIDFVNQGTIHDREDTLFFGVHEVPPGNNAFFDIKTFIFKTIR